MYFSKMATINLRQSTLATAVGNGRKDRYSGKKAKLEDPRNNMVKPNKRPALGNITNNATATATRKQPSRAAKQTGIPNLKEATVFEYENRFTKNSNNKANCEPKQTFDIFVDDAICSESNENESSVPTPLPNVVANLSHQPLTDVPVETVTDSPMIVSSPTSTDCVVIDSDDVYDTAEIADIEHMTDVSIGASEYTHDIYKYLRQAELKSRPKPGYMKKQTDINSNMRSILIDWLVEVAEEYKLMEQTLYLTVNYIDRFLSCMSVLRGKLQLVGTACMLIASKFEEIYPPEVSEFVYITDDTYTAKQVLRMEHLILKTLKFDLSSPTAFNFLERYLAAANASSDDSRLGSLAKYLCELTLLDYDPYLKYLPSTIAASCVCLACSTLGMPIWTPTMSYHMGYRLDELESCILDVHKTYVGSTTHPQQAVRDKYKLIRHHQVSQMLPPQQPPV